MPRPRNSKTRYTQAELQDMIDDERVDLDIVSKISPKSWLKMKGAQVSRASKIRSMDLLVSTNVCGARFLTSFQCVSARR